MMKDKMPLRDAPVGVPLKVVEFDCGREAQYRLIGLGILTGSRIIITNKFSSDGPFSVIVNGSKIVVGRGVLNRIYVVPDNEIALRIGIVGREGVGKRRLLEKLCDRVDEIYQDGYLSPILRGQVVWSGKRIEIEVLPSILGDFPISIKEEVGLAFALRGNYDRLLVLGKEDNLERDLLLVQYLVEFGKEVVLAMDDGIRKVNLKVLETLTGIKMVRISIERGYGFEAFFEGRGFPEKQRRLVPQLEECVEDCVREIVARFSQKSSGTLYPLDAVVRKILETPQDIEFFFCQHDIREELEKIVREKARICKEVLGESISEHIFERRLAIVRGVLESASQTQRISGERIRDILIFLAGLFLFSFALISVVRYPLLPLLSFLTKYSGNSWQYLIGLIGILFTFVPAVAVFLFFFFFLQEGNFVYRVAFELDNLLHVFGLHGEVFLPVIANIGCSMSAIESASRHLSGKDQISVLLSLPFGNCTGTLLVFGVFCALFFSPVVASLIMLAILIASTIYTVLVATIMRFILNQRSLSPPEPMQFPEVRIVPLSVVLFNTMRGVKIYLRNLIALAVPVLIILWVGYYKVGIKLTELPFLDWIGHPVGLSNVQVLSLALGVIAKELIIVSQFLFDPTILKTKELWKWFLLFLFLSPGCLPVYFRLTGIINRKTVWKTFVFGFITVYILISFIRHIGGWL